MQLLFRLSIALAAATLGAIAVLVVCPLLIKGHQFNLRCVRARFTTPAEQFTLAAEATKAGKPVFGALYDAQMNRMIAAYVPPRSSLTYTVLNTINFGDPIAAKEDFLPAPPAPMAFEFIDEGKATPLTLSEFAACRKHWLLTLVPFAILFSVAAWFARSRSSRENMAPAAIG